MHIKAKIVGRLATAVFMATVILTMTGNAVFACSEALVPHGGYNTVIAFQDGSGRVETGTLTFSRKGTLIETNTAVPGQHAGTWASTGNNSFSLTFTEPLSPGCIVTVVQTDDEFTQDNANSFSGTSVGTVTCGGVVVGQGTTHVTATKMDD